MNEHGTILFAEDDDNDAFLFQTALKKAGVQNPMRRVRNGEEALHYLAGSGRYTDRAQYPFPCLLITDLKMPRLSGFDLLDHARSILESHQVPAIVLSASVSESDRSRSLGLGAHCYFVKPSNFPAFVAIAAEVKQTWLAPVTQHA